MPQLDFSVFPSQLFWLSICFFAMLFIMNRFIIPKTAEMIKLRKDKIDGDLEKAAEIKRQVEKTLENYNQALQTARTKADVSLQKTREELFAMIERRQADLTASLKVEIETGEKKINAAKEKALQTTEENAAELAVAVLHKLGFAAADIKDTREALNILDKE